MLTQTQVYRCEIIRKLNFYSRTRLHQATTSSLNSKFQTNLFQQKLSFACVPICLSSRRQQALVRKKKEKLKQAENLFRNRHDLVRKRSKMSKTQKQRLDLLTSLSPTLVTLRKFTDDLHTLFSLRRSPSKAWQIWRRMRRTAKYRQIPALAKALEVLCKPNMNKLLVYLKQPLHQRTKIRTNNHVERCNRKLRYLEKVRYKWRRSKTIIRHVLLQFQNWIKSKPSKRQTEN